MIISLSMLLTPTLLGLGILHFNWALGGTYGFEKALPTKMNGQRVLNPGKISSGIVGIVLTTFGLFYFLKVGMVHLNLPGWISEYGGWIIPTIFIMRATGEFNYVGFFKRKRQTDFGRRDTKLYSPLSLLIGGTGLVIQILQK